MLRPQAPRAHAISNVICMPHLSVRNLASLSYENRFHLRCVTQLQSTPAQKSTRGKLGSHQARKVVGKTVSSTRWLRRQLTDQFVRRAHEEDKISRAAFKLEQMQARYKFLEPGNVVIDLGSAPGGWTKFAHGIVHPKKKEKAEVNTEKDGLVISVDLKGLQLDTNIRHGLVFIRNDFMRMETRAEIKAALSGRPADAVLSDMHPHATGDHFTDHMSVLHLARTALLFATKVLRPGGHFIAKLTRGGDEDLFKKEVEELFTRVVTAKPEASRPNSAEIYIFGTGFRPRSATKM